MCPVPATAGVFSTLKQERSVFRNVPDTVEFWDNCLNDVFTAAEQENPLLSVTLSSEPKRSPHTPPSRPPRLLDTRKTVLPDESETSRSFESVMEGKALTGARDSG